MPTTYKDQFHRIDPGNCPAFETALTEERAFCVGYGGNDFIYWGPDETPYGHTRNSRLVSDLRVQLLTGCDDVQVAAMHLFFDARKIIFADSKPSGGCLAKSGLAQHNKHQSAEIPVLSDMKCTSVAANPAVPNRELFCLLAV